MWKIIFILVISILTVNGQGWPKKHPKNRNFRPNFQKDSRSVDPPGNTRTNCNHVTFGIPTMPDSRKDVIQFSNNIRNKEACQAMCRLYPKCRSYYFDNKDDECYIMSLSFIDFSKLISKIGAPKNCEAKVNECVPMEGDCDLEGDDVMSQVDETFTVDTCKRMCEASGKCVYYYLTIHSQQCKMYGRQERKCRGFIGSSDQVLQACEQRKNQKPKQPIVLRPNQQQCTMCMFCFPTTACPLVCLDCEAQITSQVAQPSASGNSQGWPDDTFQYQNEFQGQKKAKNNQMTMAGKHRVGPGRRGYGYRVGNFPEVQSNIGLEICNPTTSQYFGEIRVNIDPYPIVAVTGRQMKASMSFNLIKAIEPGTKVAVSLVKKNVFLLGDVTIPCMDMGMPIQIGSCTYDLSQIMSTFQFCPAYCPEEQQASLPLKPGLYQGPPHELTVPQIPLLANLFAAGNIELTVRVSDGTNNEIGCFKTSLSITT